jgi:hypothetical protein
VMTCGLAEDAVTETEHEAVVPLPIRAQEEAGLNVSVATEELKVTEPVGAVVAPGLVFVIVAVTVDGWPTTTVPLENEIPDEVERMFTVRFAFAADAWCVELPA